MEQARPMLITRSRSTGLREIGGGRESSCVAEMILSRFLCKLHVATEAVFSRGSGGAA
jgi:hypothetical protein